MIILRNMLAQDYAAYRNYFIQDYSQEIHQNYGHSMEVAIQLAEKALHDSFPDGLTHTTHTLMCIDVRNGKKMTHVGYLWHAINQSDKSTFIYDFYISPEHQSKGYGKKAIDEFTRQMQAVEIEDIKLRVAFHNKRAFKLYQDIGFLITGYTGSAETYSKDVYLLKVDINGKIK